MNIAEWRVEKRW